MNNILYINTSDVIGGAAKVAWNLGHHLDKKYTHSFITFKKYSNENNVFQIPKNKHFQLTQKIFGEKNLNYLRYLEGFLLSDDVDYGFGWKQIKENKFYINSNIVHLHNLHGNYFNLNTLAYINKPIVWTLHDEWAIMPHGAWSDYFDKNDKFYKRNSLISYPPMLFNNEKHLMEQKKEIYKKINPILVTPSLWLKKRVEKSVLSDKTIKLIPNGINVNIYKSQNKNPLRSKLKLPIDKKIILFLASGGRNNPQKGWEHTNRIINDFKNKGYLFICVGGAENRSFRDGNVIYIPFIKDEYKLSEYYSAADVFLFTSNHENFPLTTLEAMASGLPVVSFSVGGVSEQIIDGKTGFLAKMFDYNDMEKKIILLMSDNDLLENVSKEANRHVMINFNLLKMVEEYQKIYNELLDTYL